MISDPDEIEAAICRILSVLSDYSGGLNNVEAKAAADKEIRFIEDRLTFANFEIAKLRNSILILFGPKRTRGDVDTEKGYARSHCASLRCKVDELRHYSKLNGGA